MKTIFCSIVFLTLFPLFILLGDVLAEDNTQNNSQNKLKVLFLCTGNSCRSQMAEGWTRQLKGDKIEVYSAGIETHGLNPNAVRVMKEAGVDISKQKSQHIDEFKNTPLDYVITVCSHADEHCPVFPRSIKVVHHPFDDPPKLAKAFEKEEDQLNCYRKVRDEIKAYVETLPEALKKEKVKPYLEFQSSTTSKKTTRNRGLFRFRRITR
jgi:arsenate reductase